MDDHTPLYSTSTSSNALFPMPDISYTKRERKQFAECNNSAKEDSRKYRCFTTRTTSFAFALNTWIPEKWIGYYYLRHNDSKRRNLSKKKTHQFDMYPNNCAINNGIHSKRIRMTLVTLTFALKRQELCNWLFGYVSVGRITSVSVPE